jgi:AraC-like DNA-binding protein
VDVLSDVLARARAHGAVFSVLGRREPWGLAFSGARPLVVHMLLRGRACLARGRSRFQIGSGDVVLVRGGEKYSLASGDDVQFEPIEAARAGPAYDSGSGAEAIVLCGAYTIGGEPGAGLLSSLPTELMVPAGQHSDELRMSVGILAAEAARAAPGQQTVLDRALDLMLVQVLRDAFAGGLWAAPGWYRALGDQGLSAVLAAVHEAPQQRWTVESMAAVAHLSRAGFARRFAETVGETPAAYVTGLRVERAAERLQTTTKTVATVAIETGFASEFSLSAAFKRRYGVPPGRWRNLRRRPRRI